ncbi:SMI1/KNR4 family protein [Amycolatopsis sp. FU40]|uniref:SMI1/KNR4 family protein n=1 Tax=Amycolatopsis sp. FU40 TaxID=2914159 RepID=UPI001F340DB2|nr:SMI1/KNR4 family protein [Amycolatopsis sp. FU40]UKD59404.1 SMI1/KNR4 family protein [Amycolatopsis sp. FU40]
MTEPVTQAWQRITAVLREHAPATAHAIHPAGPADNIRELERIVGRRLPADLLTWWSVTDGVDDRRDYHAGSLIPTHFMPLSVTRAREEYAGNAEYPDPGCCTAYGEHRKPAGEPAFPYCTALVPVCRSIDGGLLCVDLRPGQDHGCVMTWYASEGAYAVEWDDVTAMLAYVAERLDDHAAGRVPDRPESRVVIDNDGALNWGMAAN